MIEEENVLCETAVLTTCLVEAAAHRVLAGGDSASSPSRTEPSLFSLLSSLFLLLSPLLFSQIPLRECHFDLCIKPSTARQTVSTVCGTILGQKYCLLRPSRLDSDCLFLFASLCALPSCLLGQDSFLYHPALLGPNHLSSLFSFPSPLRECHSWTARQTVSSLGGFTRLCHTVSCNCSVMSEVYALVRRKCSHHFSNDASTVLLRRCPSLFSLLSALFPSL